MAGKKCKEKIPDVSDTNQTVLKEHATPNSSLQNLKVVSATFLLVYFVCLKESICETRRNAFYFTSKALLVFEIITF